MKKTVTKEKLAVYRSMLPYGSIKLIAERAGVEKQSVDAFLRGRSNSWNIENAVLSVIADLKAEREELLKRAGFAE